MLPGEQAARQHLRQLFADDFQLAREVLELGYAVHNSLCAEHTSKFSNLTKGICVGTYTKLCKQYRSIHALCELGLTDDAQILVRATFEASLVVLFLLRHRVKLNNGRRKPPRPKGGRLSVDFRAKLYGADQAVKMYKMIQSWLTTPGLKRSGRRNQKNADEAMNAARRDVGENWVDWLRGGNILGLPIEVLSRNLGFGPWYAAVYRHQSRKVHGADAIDHLDGDETSETITPDLRPDETTTTVPLSLANQLFIRVTDLINSRFDLGHEEAIRRVGQRIITHGL
jgi:hypothetical protein